MPEVHKSFCRICQAFCGYEIHVEDNRIVRLRGDETDPQSEGYACFKGIRHAELYDSAKRLVTAQKRVGDGFVPLPTETALTEAGRRLRAIVDAHGPGAVGFFIGTQALFNSTAPTMIHAFAQALPTPRVFTTMTIDQSAKWVGELRMGGWAGGPLPFEQADVWMFVGSNPMVSMVAGAGPAQFAFTNPAKRMARAKARGMKTIVVDPRATETAKLADLHLQLHPGWDAELAAALLHTVLENGWQDENFCADYVDQLDALGKAVARFSPEAVADLVGVPSSDIRLAAKMFAHEATRGMVGTGTGPDMALHSNTAEHLYQALNVICGRFPRAGQKMSSPRILRPPLQPTADVALPAREWETGPKSLTHGLGRIRGVMMSSEIAGEITHESPDRMRAMICVGGNLAVALPDQATAENALAQLELLVVIDPLMTATARLADYVIAPKLQYERADHTQYLEGMFQTPFVHVTPPVVRPPEDVVDDWYALWRIAGQAGLQLQVAGRELPMDEAPTTEALMALVAGAASTPYAEIAARRGAQSMEIDPPTIGPRTSPQRFQLLPSDVAEELAHVEEGLDSRADAAPGSDLRLIVRRHKETMNSTGVALDATRKLYPGAPVYMHPDDLAARGLSAGQSVLVSRGDAAVGGVARADPTLRRGLIAMSHGWSSGPGEPFVATNALVDPDRGAQTINRMPVMTGLSVQVRPAR